MGNGLIRLRVGGAYVLAARSWFNLIFTFAHEMGHAIDPCELRSMHLSIPAYDRIRGCFLRNGLIAARRTRAECARDDQLAETFADWVAVEITSQALAPFALEFGNEDVLSAVANSVRDLCDQTEMGGGVPDLEYHPSPQIRIEEIFGRHPAIRSLLGCASWDALPEYCSWETK